MNIVNERRESKKPEQNDLAKVDFIARSLSYPILRYPFSSKFSIPGGPVPYHFSLSNVLR